MCRSSLLCECDCVCVCVCVSICVCRGGGVQPFCMSGAVSGHQSARQRQAEQIISRDAEGKGKREKGRIGEGEGEKECGDRAEGRPQCCVFNIHLSRMTQTGLSTAHSRNHTYSTSILPPLSSHQPHDCGPQMPSHLTTVELPTYNILWK